MSNSERWDLVKCTAQAFVLAALSLFLIFTLSGCDPDEPVVPLAPVVATPTPTPAPVCNASAMRNWSARRALPEDGSEVYEFLDHEWVYLRAQVVDVKGKGLDPECDWDQYVSWDRLSGDADCRTYGGANNTRIGLYCFGIGDVSLCSNATKDGLHLKACSHFFVRAQPVN